MSGQTQMGGWREGKFEQPPSSARQADDQQAARQLRGSDRSMVCIVYASGLHQFRVAAATASPEQPDHLFGLELRVVGFDGQQEPVVGGAVRRVSS